MSDDRIRELEAQCAEMQLALIRVGTRHSFQYLEGSSISIGGKDVWVCPECHESTPVEVREDGFPVTPQEFPHKPRCMIQQIQQALSSDAGKGILAELEQAKASLENRDVYIKDMLEENARLREALDRAQRLIEFKSKLPDGRCGFCLGPWSAHIAPCPIGDALEGSHERG